jgi:hypothetical protein
MAEDKGSKAKDNNQSKAGHDETELTEVSARLQR